MARKSRKNPVDTLSAPSLCISTAFYIRLSTEDNGIRGCSIGNQNLVLNDYISDKPEFTVYDIYIDNGMTGTNFRRPAFQRMLSDIEAGHINCVIVKDLSRLGRNVIDTGYYIEQYFHTHQVRFIAVTDQFDTEDPNNLLSGVMLPLKNMINEAYALDIGKKVKAQVRQAMMDGKFVGGRTPYGYRKDPENCHKLLIDEPAARVVRQIFQWAYEQVSMSEIARRLNEAKIDPPGQYKHKTGELASEKLTGNGVWQHWNVERILSRELYVGDLVQGKSKKVNHKQVSTNADEWIVVRDTHEAIISRELFDAVQVYRNTIVDGIKSASKISYTQNIFKGKVFCAHCGRYLHRLRYKRKSCEDCYKFYCTTNTEMGKGACEGVLIREEALIATVIDVLEKELTVSLGKSTSLFQLNAQQQKRDSIQSSIAEKQREIEKKRKLVCSLYENYVEQILTGEEYLSLKENYEESITALSEKIAALENSIKALDEQRERHQSMEKDADLLKQDHALTASLIDRLIERIEITHDKNVHIDFRFKNEFSQKGVLLPS